MKKLLGVIVLVLVAVSAFAQQRYPGASIDHYCAERLYVANWSNASVNMLCVAENGSFDGVEFVFGGTPDIRRILPLDSGALYGAAANKIYKYWGNYGPRVDVWRVPSGGFASVSNQISWDWTNLSLRFPGDKEESRLLLYSFGAYDVRRPFPNDHPNLKCINTASTADGYEFCLEVAQEPLVSLPSYTAFGPDYSKLATFFAGERPVNIASGKDTIYVLLASRWVDPTPVPSVGPVVPSTVIPGKLVALRPNGDQEVLVNGINVVDDYSLDRLVASSRGIYYVSQVQRTQNLADGMNSVVWFYDFKTKQPRPAWTGGEYDFFSALALVPAMNNAVAGK